LLTAEQIAALDREALVAHVKSIQRSSRRSNQEWLGYCRECLGGVRDPTKHDDSALRAFIFLLRMKAEKTYAWHELLDPDLKSSAIALPCPETEH